jgi:hypothetical protein
MRRPLFALAKECHQTELGGRELGDLAATFESDLDLRDFFALARPALKRPAGRSSAPTRNLLRPLGVSTSYDLFACRDVLPPYRQPADKLLAETEQGRHLVLWRHEGV